MKNILTIFIVFIICLRLFPAGDTSNIAIRRLTMNSEKSDFSPFLYNKKLFFVSARYNGSGIVHEQYNGSTTDIYFSEGTDSLNFKFSTELGKPINTKWNEGPFTISKTGNEIYFTASAKDNKLAIFVSLMNEGKWSQPVLLPFCKPGNNYCHPSLTADGNRLYFCTDQKNGFGGMDIFYSDFVNGQWAEPRNAGKKINTPGNELFPFVCAAKQLYFASNRGDVGGLDIYSFQFADSSTKLLPAPINSKHDDFGVWIDASAEFGFFSTNRNKKYSDDIYVFSKRFPDQSELKPLPEKNSWCYTFYEETTLINDDTENLAFEWDFGDGSKARNLTAKHCYTATGNYNVQLNVIEKVSGEVFRSEATFPLSVKNETKAGIISSDTLPAGKPLELAAFFNLPGHEAVNYYWKIGDRHYLTGEKIRHVFKQKGSYRVILAVIAKNKSTGKNEKFKIEKSLLVRGRKDEYK